MIVIGIDPGVSGGIGVVRSEQLVRVEDMPVEKKPGDATVQRRIAARELALLLRDIRGSFAGEDVLAVVEAQQVIPGKKKGGAAGRFSLAESAGVIRGVLATLGIRSEWVAPQRWKNRFALKADKHVALERACALFPDHASDFKRVKDHNRAEAALIALYGWGRFA